MPKFRIEYDQQTYQTRAGDPSGKPYTDQGEENTSTAIHGIRRVEDGEYFDVICDKEATIYYLLYVVYETGDSFSRKGGVIEFVDLYSDEELAARNAKRIRENADGEQKHSIMLETEDGDFVRQHCPWEGFFEHVENIIVKPVMSGGGSF